MKKVFVLLFSAVCLLIASGSGAFESPAYVVKNGVTFATYGSSSYKQPVRIAKRAERQSYASRVSYNGGDARISFIRPVPGWLTQGLHGKYHNALDFHAPIGTPVKAVADGIVVSTKWSYMSGNVLTLSHGKGIETVYCHLSAYEEGIKPGVIVQQGQVVAYSGDTGWDCYGPHLHFDVHGMKNPFADEWYHCAHR